MVAYKDGAAVKLVSRQGRDHPDLATPPIFMAFDWLYVRGQDLRARPLYVRRNVVEDVLDGQDLVLPVRRLAEDGLAGRARARLRGPGGEGPGLTLRWRAHAQVAEGQATRVPSRGARLGTEVD